MIALPPLALTDSQGLPVSAGDALHYDSAKQGWSMYGEMTLVLKWMPKQYRYALVNKRHGVAWDVSAAFVKSLTLIKRPVKDDKDG